jgi:hypothetical protein
MMRGPTSQTEAAIRATIAVARAAEMGGGWITYLARDPRQPDLKGNRGWPIYVGQSKEFGKRVRKHLRTSEKLAMAHDSVRKRIREMLHDGHVPIFEVLDRQSTRYDIANLRRLQNEAGPPVTKHDIPTNWLWEFGLGDAIADGIRIRLACTGCGEAPLIDAVHFQRLRPAPLDLRVIKEDPIWLTQPCTSCGRRGSRSVDLEVI